MTSALSLFTMERFQYRVTIPLSVLLFGAPFSLAPAGPLNFGVGVLSTFLVLLCLRIADDVQSIETDAIDHPERGLASGRISVKGLLVALAVMIGVVLLINCSSGIKVLGLAGVGLYYALFFFVKARLYPLIRPLLSNLMFALLPLYASFDGGPGVLKGAFLMGLFSWTAAVAHEYGHSVRATYEDGAAGQPDYTAVLGPRNNAILATAAFGVSLVSGLLFWCQAGRPGAFLTLLAVVTLQLGFLCGRLIQSPCMVRAKPFYIYGFTFFLLPQAGFIVDQFWKLGQPMSSLAQIAYLVLPIILAGTCNMVFVKSRWAPWLKIPMDNGYRMADGKRMLGDHKTWKGFLGMILFSGGWLIFFGILDRLIPALHSLSLIPFETYSLGQMGTYGAFWGLGYVVPELPNSYVKRRIDIGPGKTGKGWTGVVFSFIDQADSVAGCLCAMLLFYVPAFLDLVAIFLFSVLVHYAMNVLLYLLKLKSQPH